VLRVSLPLPIGKGLTLSGFLGEMKHQEGRADLIERNDDPQLPGVRFVAESNIHRVRCNLIVRGWRAWFVYAGTLVGQPIMPMELELATQAREHTRVGLDT
jgi:hypothetical protein